MKNPTYWGKDENGDQLPYLDGVEFIYSPDTAGQIEGLQGGALNWVGGITSEQKQIVEADPNLKTITTLDQLLQLELQIRVDQGAGKDLRSSARRCGTAPTARPSSTWWRRAWATPGNGTFVGPAYKAYYLARAARVRPGDGQAAARRGGLRRRRRRSSSSRRRPTRSRPSPPPGRRR